MKPKINSTWCLPALTFLCLAPISRTHAETWNATTPNPADWQLAANWNPATVPNAIGASALLSNDLAAGTLAINLNGAVTLGNLTIGDSVAGTNGFFNVQNGTGGSLTFDASAGNATLLKTTGSASTDTISATTTLTDTLAADVRTGTINITGLIGGAGGIIRSGAVLGAPTTVGGTLGLSNNSNSYTGSTTIEHGTLTAVLSGDILASTNSVLGNSATAIAVGLSSTAGNANGTSVLTFTAGSDAANYTISRGIDFSQSTTSTARAALNFNGNSGGAINTNTLTLSGPLTFGVRATQIAAGRGGMTLNITGAINTVGIPTTDSIRWNAFPPDPGATVVDGRGAGTIRFSNLSRSYSNSQNLVMGRIIIDGVVAATGDSPIGTQAIGLGVGSGGNIVGAGNFAGAVSATRDTSPDTVRSLYLESAGSSYARLMAPGVGSGSTPAAGGYGSAVNVINGYQFGGLNSSGTVTFSGAITPGNPTVGASSTNVITNAVNIALIAQTGGTVEFTGGIGDTSNTATNLRVTVNQFRNHANLDGYNNSTNLLGSDGIADATANQLIGTATGGTVVLGTTAGTWDGTTEVLGGKFIVNSSIAGDTLTVGSGATLGGSGTINAGIVNSTTQINGTLAPGSSAGILTMNKALSFNAASVFSAEINGTGVGAQYDQLAANSTITVDPTSQLLLTLGFVPNNGDSFTLISLATGNIGGTFANLSEGGSIFASYLSNSYEFQGTYLGGTGNDLVLTAIPEPGTSGVLASVSALLLLVRRRSSSSAGRVRDRIS